MTLDPALLAAYLRQRADFGEKEVVFAGLEKREVLRLLAAVRAGAAVEETAAHGHGHAHGAGPAVSPSAGVVLEEPVRVPVPGSSPSPRPGLDPVRALNVLRDDALACTRCGLRQGATQVVFGDGLATAEVVVVGEAPGADEDRTGVPFVGKAGKMLDLLLESVGFPRERVYICNVLKCRPPGNRDPQPNEVHECSPWLKRQIELIRPRVILAVGRFAAQTLTNSDAPMNRLRGRVHAYEGTPLVATYHPSYLLRTPGDVRKCWEDLQLLRRTFDGAAA